MITMALSYSEDVPSTPAQPSARTASPSPQSSMGLAGGDTHALFRAEDFTSNFL